MKKITYIFLGILFCISTVIYAANTVTGPEFPEDYKSVYYSISIDATNAEGEECANLDGYIYKMVMVDVTAGTIDMDMEITNNGTFYQDWSADVTGIAADAMFEGVTPFTEICAHVNTCTACTAVVYIRGQGYSRDFKKSR